MVKIGTRWARLGYKYKDVAANARRTPVGRACVSNQSSSGLRCLLEMKRLWFRHAPFCMLDLVRRLHGCTEHMKSPDYLGICYRRTSATAAHLQQQKLAWQKCWDLPSLAIGWKHNSTSTNGKLLARPRRLDVDGLATRISDSVS